MEAGERGLHGRNVTQDVQEQEENRCEHENVTIQNQKMEERLASERKRRKELAE